MQTTAVVILNWNGVEQLRSFLPSVVNHTPEADIIVADNASTDSSVEWLRNTYPQVRIIQLNYNYGYAGGYNEALKQVDNTYLVLLNSDVEVAAGWLEPLVQTLDTDSSIGACQPKILSQRAPSHFEYAGAAGGFIDAYGIPFCRGRVFASIEKDNNQYNDTIQIFWASGACLAVRNEVFKKAKGFDADFFAHMEEIDLCWTMQRMGYTIFCNPKSIVYHVGAATLKIDNPKKVFLNFRNSLWMLYKQLPSRMLFPILFIRLCMDGMAGIHYLIRGQWRQTIAIFNAHMAFYFSNNKRSKRKALAQYPYYYHKQKTILHTSIILAYYARGRKKFSSLSWKND